MGFSGETETGVFLNSKVIKLLSSKVSFMTFPSRVPEIHLNVTTSILVFHLSFSRECLGEDCFRLSSEVLQNARELS